MIPNDILEKLVCFSDEEIDNLNGKHTIDKSIFLNENSNVIDCHKLLHKGEMISVRKHARFLEYPEHKHNYLELMYVYGGKMTHVIDNKKITINEGEMLLLNQNIEHSIKQADENDIIFNFIIKPDFFDYITTLSTQNNTIFTFLLDSIYSKKNDGEYLLFKVADNTIVKEYVESIILHVYQPEITSGVILKLLVGLLLMEIMSHPECIKSYASDSYDRIMATAILQYIGQNYQEGLLSAISKKLHQPNYKICRVIKAYTGMTFKQLIQETRLQHANELLKTTNLPVTAIMEEVGYENITYFYKIYKNKYTMTPKEYRKSNSNIL